MTNRDVIVKMKITTFYWVFTLSGSVRHSESINLVNKEVTSYWFAVEETASWFAHEETEIQGN